MLVTSISPRGAFPKFNLTNLAASAESTDQRIMPPLDWLQSQQNNGGLLPIKAYVDKSSNVYINDVELYLQYFKHCLGICSAHAFAEVC